MHFLLGSIERVELMIIGDSNAAVSVQLTSPGLLLCRFLPHEISILGLYAQRKNCLSPISPSPRRASGEKGSHFWEGGQGCRDQRHLDRGDSHKHSNSRFKTQSKRSERVGQRGKQLREQRQAAKAD